MLAVLLLLLLLLLLPVRHTAATAPKSCKSR
jgi:hypothetical protein